MGCNHSRNRMTWHLLAGVAALLLWGGAPGSAEVAAAVVERPIVYEVAGESFEGVLVYDDAATGPRPGVLVIHAWWGRGADELARARQLAELGYVAFAADLFGQGKQTDQVQQAQAWAGPFYADRTRFRTRAAAGLAVLAEQQEVNPRKLAAIGYCFGGTAVLELAFGGSALAPGLRGVVSFHGSPLPAGEGDAARARSIPLLVCHGEEDPMVPREQIAAFLDSLKAGPVDCQLISYSGAVHSFTTRSVDAHNLPGARYHEPSDRRSWGHLQQFLVEVLQ